MEEALKAGLATLCYAAALLVFFHFLRRRMGRWGSSFLAAVLAVFCVLPLYGMNPYAYLQETRVLVEGLRTQAARTVPAIILTLVALPVVYYKILPREYIQYWRIFGPPRQYQYRYVAAGQVTAGAVFAYLIWATEDMAILLLFLALAVLLVLEYSRLMPLSKPLVSEVAREWVEPASMGRWRVYLPGFLFLAGCLSVVLFFPDSALPAVLLLGISNPLASMVGMRFGRHRLPYNPRKTLEGTACFLLTSYLLLLLLRGALSLLPVSLAVTLTESACPKDVDNFVVPFSGALFLTIL